MKDSFELALAYEREGRLDEAVSLLWRTVETVPQFEPAHTRLAIVLLALGRPEEALHCRRRAAALVPNDAVAQIALASLLRRLGRFTEAITLYRQIAASRPDDVERKCQLVDSLFALDSFTTVFEMNSHATMFEPASAPKPRGFVDAITNERVAGWVWDETSPSTRQLVEIWVNSSLIARTNADRFRRDLLEAGIGDGFHAFEYRFNPPIHLTDTVSCRVEGLRFRPISSSEHPTDA